MTTPDLNLLVTLQVLLAEGSVAGAARRLDLSPSATSRALARLREATGDPLLVRAGRGLVPTPRALEMKERLGSLVAEAEAALRPAEALDFSRLDRVFTVRASDGFVENFGPELVARVARDAPKARLRFLAKTSRDSAGLRDGTIDLETGVVDETLAPELRTRALFGDRFVGAVGAGHELAEGEVTLDRYLSGRHVHVSRHGGDRGIVDAALAGLGAARHIATIVGGFAAALALCRGTDLIATVPERHTGNLRDGLRSFALPFEMPHLTIAMIWHPRQDADAANRWLRACVRDVCSTPSAPRRGR